MRLTAERRITGREMNAIFVETPDGPVEVTMAAVGSFDCTPYEPWMLRYSYTAELFDRDGRLTVVVRARETGGERPSERLEVHHSADGGRTWSAGATDLGPFEGIEPIATLEG